jgi:hypothetical protein
LTSIRCARRVHLAHDVVQRGIQAAVRAGPQRGQPRDHALEMRGQRFLPPRRACLLAAIRPDPRDADRPLPLVEDVEHVGRAELDAHGPAARSLSVIALEVPIDAAVHDLDRNALCR